MKLIEIKEGVTYKAKGENIYYKRNGEYIYKNYFYTEDIKEYRFEVKSIDELNKDVYEMELDFFIKYNPGVKGISIRIGQADNRVYLNTEGVQQLLEKINETLDAPF